MYFWIYYDLHVPLQKQKRLLKKTMTTNYKYLEISLYDTHIKQIQHIKHV